jgi:hypothetical protein
VKRLITVAALTTSLTLGAATPAFAAWMATSLTGRPTVAASRLQSGTGTPTAAPNPAVNSSTVRVAFNAASIKGTDLASYAGYSYNVSRYPALTGGTAVITTACSSASLCDVVGVPDGTWYFEVVPAFQNWRGVAMTRARVVVDAPPTVTVKLANGGGGSKIDITGTASTTDGKVTVYLCRSSTCTASNASYTNANIIVTNGTWSDSTPSIGTGVWYAVAQQTDSAGNTGTSATFGPFTR